MIFFCNWFNSPHENNRFSNVSAGFKCDNESAVTMLCVTIDEKDKCKFKIEITSHYIFHFIGSYEAMKQEVLNRVREIFKEVLRKVDQRVGRDEVDQ